MKTKIYEMPYKIKNAIYFLIKDEEIVYVGQTTNGFKRILQHCEKDFNKYAFIEIEKTKLNYFEDYYIMKYQPKYNRYYNLNRIGLNSSYRKLNYIIKNKLSLEEYIIYLQNNNVEILKFKEILTIKKDDYKIIKNKLNEKYGVLI